MGFTFDDTDTKGVASSIAEMHRLIGKNPKNAERIFPYIGGEEINTSPTHAHHRYVINFGEMTEEEAREGWPDLIKVLEEKVRPERTIVKDKGAKEKWWQFIRPRPELHAAIAGYETILVTCRHQPQYCVSWQPVSAVYAESLIVFALVGSENLAVMQSSVHELWARTFGSSLEDRLRYTPSDCFESFPFPEDTFAPSPTTRKKPYRLRWPDPFRDEVLARLLELNSQCAREELIAGAAMNDSKTKKTSTPKRKPRKTPNSGGTPTLPGM